MRGRRKALWALSCAVCLTLCGCGGQSSQPAVSVYDLQKAMVEADASLPEMLTANSNETQAKENFGYLSSLDYDKVEGYFLAYSAQGLADELAVIVLKDEDDVPEAVDSLKEHVQGRVDMYSFYEPEQAPRAEGAEVFSQGRYAVLIISDDPAASRTAFQQLVSG